MNSQSGVYGVLHPMHTVRRHQGQTCHSWTLWCEAQSGQRWDRARFVVGVAIGRGSWSGSGSDLDLDVFAVAIGNPALHLRSAPGSWSWSWSESGSWSPALHLRSAPGSWSWSWSESRSIESTVTIGFICPDWNLRFGIGARVLRFTEKYVLQPVSGFWSAASTI